MVLRRGSSNRSPQPLEGSALHGPGREREQHKAHPTSTRREELTARKDTEGIYEYTGMLGFTPNCTSNEYELTTEHVYVCESLCVCVPVHLSVIYI